MFKHRIIMAYVKAFIKLIAKKGHLDQVYEDMVFMQKIDLQHPIFNNFCQHPAIKNKSALLAKVFDGHLQPYTRQLLDVLNKKKQLYLLPELIPSFIQEYKAYKNIQPVYLNTSLRLNDQMQQAFIQKIQQIIPGQSIELITKVDPSLIAGYQMRIQDQQIDNSIQKKLHTLKLRFTCVQ